MRSYRDRGDELDEPEANGLGRPQCWMCRRVGPVDPDGYCGQCATDQWKGRLVGREARGAPYGVRLAVGFWLEGLH